MALVTPNQLSLDAKLNHIGFALDRSLAVAIHPDGQPMGLYHPTRDIVIDQVFSEVTESHATADGSYHASLWTAAGAQTTDAYFIAATAFAQATVRGVWAEMTLAKNRIVAGTVFYPEWTNSSNAGSICMHVWYFFEQNKSDHKKVIL